MFSGTLAGLLSMSVAAGSAAANECASASDLAALRTAVLQQELMVAAFSCHDVDLYNRFVTAHQPELIASDAKLKAFFVRRDAHHGEAGYHTYKTELANASSLRYLRDDGFCADAGSEFRVALQSANLVDSRNAGSDEIAASYDACPGALPLMRTADVQPPVHAESTEERYDSRHADDHHDRGTAQMSTPAAHREIDDAP
jgi:hypothetical protein